jgi:hypothetical protein
MELSSSFASREQKHIKCRYDRIPPHFATVGVQYVYRDGKVTANMILFTDKTSEDVPEFVTKMMSDEEKQGFEKGIYTKLEINLGENVLNGFIEADDTILKIKHKLIYYLQKTNQSEGQELLMTNIHLWGVFERVDENSELVEQEVILGYELQKDSKRTQIPTMNPYLLNQNEVSKEDEIYNFNFIDRKTRKIREQLRVDFVDKHFTIIDDYIRKYGSLKSIRFAIMPEFEQYCKDLSTHDKPLLKDMMYINRIKYWTLNERLNDSIVETLYNIDLGKLERTINYEVFSTYVVNEMGKHIYKNDKLMKMKGCTISDIEFTYTPDYIDDGLVNLPFVFKYFELTREIPYMRMKLKDIRETPHKIHKNVRKFNYSESLVKSWFASTYSYKMANGKRNQYLAIRSDAITFKINIPHITLTSDGYQEITDVFHTVYLHSSGEMTIRLIWSNDIDVTLDMINNTIEQINKLLIIPLNEMSFHSAGKNRRISLDMLPQTEVNDSDKYTINSIITMLKFDDAIKYYMDSITYTRQIFNILCHTAKLFGSYVYTSSKCGTYSSGTMTGETLQEVNFRYKKISEYSGKTLIESMLLNIVKDYDTLEAIKMITERLNINPQDANVIYSAIKETVDEESTSSKLIDTGSVEITVNSDGVLIYGVHGIEELHRVNMFMDVLFTYIFPSPDLVDKVMQDKEFLNGVLEAYKGMTIEYSMNDEILQTIQGINRKTQVITDDTLQLLGDILQEYSIVPTEQRRIEQRVDRILESQREFNEEIQQEEQAHEELSELGTPSTELDKSKGTRTTGTSAKLKRGVINRLTLSRMKTLPRLQEVDSERFKSGGVCTTAKQPSISTVMTTEKRPAILSEDSFIELLNRLRTQSSSTDANVKYNAKMKLERLKQGAPLRKMLSDGKESPDIFYYYFCPYAYCYVCNEIFLKSEIETSPEIIRPDNSNFRCPYEQKNPANHRENIMHVTQNSRMSSEYPHFTGCNCLVKQRVLSHQIVLLKQELFGEVEIWKERTVQKTSTSDYILAGHSKLIGERYGFLPITLNEIFNPYKKTENETKKPQFYPGWFLRIGSKRVESTVRNVTNHNSFINVIGKVMVPERANTDMRKYIIDKIQQNPELFYSARQGELVTIFAHEHEDDIVDFTDTDKVREKSLRNFIQFLETDQFVDENILWDLIANDGFIHPNIRLIPVIFEATRETIDIKCPIGQNGYLKDPKMLMETYIVFLHKLENDYDIIYYNIDEQNVYVHKYDDLFEKDPRLEEMLHNETGRETKEQRTQLDILRYYKTINTVITQHVIPTYEQCDKKIDDRPFRYYRELNKIQKYDFSQIHTINDVYDSPQFNDKRWLFELKSEIDLEIIADLPTFDAVKSLIENGTNVPYDYKIKCVIINDNDQLMFVVLNNNFKIPIAMESKQQIDLQDIQVLSYRFIELLPFDGVIEYSHYIQHYLNIDLGMWNISDDSTSPSSSTDDQTIIELYDDSKEHVIGIMTRYGTIIEIYPRPLIQKYLGRLNTTLIVNKLTQILDDSFTPIGQVVNHYNRVNYVLLRNKFRLPINNGELVEVRYKLRTIKINDMEPNPLDWIESYRLLSQIVKLIPEYGRIYSMLIQNENAVGIKMENYTVLMTQPTPVRTIDVDEIGVLKMENLRFDIDEINGVISIGKEVPDLRNQLVNFRGFITETYQRLRFELSKLLSLDEFAGFKTLMIRVANSRHPIERKRDLLLEPLIKHSIFASLITTVRQHKIDMLTYEPEKTRNPCFSKKPDTCENDPHCGLCPDGTCKLYIPSDEDLGTVPPEYKVYISGGFNKYIHLLIDELAQKRFLGNEIYYDQVAVIPEEEFDIIRDTEFVIDEIDKKYTQLQKLFEQFSYSKLNDETYGLISDPTYVKMEEFVSYDTSTDKKRVNTQLPANWSRLKESMNLLRYTGNMIDMLVIGFNTVMLREERFNVVELKNHLSKYASLFVRNTILDDVRTEGEYTTKLNVRNYQIGEIELAILAKLYNLRFIILDKNASVPFSSNLYNREYSENVMSEILRIEPLPETVKYKPQISYVLLMSGNLLEHDFKYIFSHMVNSDVYMFDYTPQLLKKYITGFVNKIQQTVRLNEQQMPLLYASSSFVVGPKTMSRREEKEEEE